MLTQEHNNSDGSEPKWPIGFKSGRHLSKQHSGVKNHWSGIVWANLGSNKIGLRNNIWIEGSK